MELKTEANGVFNGYASAYAKDLQGDKIMPGAFAQSIADKRGQIPIFYNHNDDAWVGFSTALSEDGKGLMLTGQLATATTAGGDVYELLQAAAAIDFRVGMSIGFIANDWDWEGDTRTITQIDLWEASITPFPAQPKAFVADVKHARELEGYLRDVEHLSKIDARRLVRVMSDLNLSSGAMLDGSFDRHSRVLRAFARAPWETSE
jgi:HK97 family phage prohead protease